MGSGAFANAEEGAPYFRQMVVERSAGGNLWFSTNAGVGGPADGACYTVSDVNASSTPGFTRWFTFGGPGGDSMGCD